MWANLIHIFFLIRGETHTPKNWLFQPFLSVSSVALCIYPALCQHCQCLPPDPHLPQRQLCAYSKRILHFPLPPAVVIPALLSASMSLPFRSLDKWNHTILPFYDGLISLIMFSYVLGRMSEVPFWGWVMFHHTSIPPFVFVVEERVEHVDQAHLEALVTTAAMNVGV